MNRTHFLREQLDACRPGHADLTLPELAELAQALAQDQVVQEELARTHCADAALRAALRDTPIPAGLADRLLASLALVANNPHRGREILGASVQQAVATAATTQAVADSPLVSAPANSPSRSRRLFVAAIVGVAALLLCTLSIPWFYSIGGREVSRDELIQRADDWLGKALDPAGWTETPATAEQFPSAAIFGAPHHRRHIVTRPEPTIDVFDLTPPGRGGARVLLFVVTTANQYQEVPTMPYKRLTVSGGVSLGVWQRGEQLYVLAVEEANGQRLEDFFKPQPVT